MKHTAAPFDPVQEQQQQHRHHHHHHHPTNSSAYSWNQLDTHNPNSIVYANHATQNQQQQPRLPYPGQYQHLSQQLQTQFMQPTQNHLYYQQPQQQQHPSHYPNHAYQLNQQHSDVSQRAHNHRPELAEEHDDLIVQAILAAKEALEKPIEERDERDILLIDNLCSLVHGFDAFPKTVRRALAAQAVLIVIDETGKVLIVHNEELDSFCVLIFGECEQLNVTKTVPIRTYQVGDSFGVCEPTTETTRFNGHMITKCENCAFLCVKRDDFYTILTDPANYPNKETIKHKDRNGNIVCVSQFDIKRKSSGPLWTNHQMQSTTNPFKIVLPDGHVIVKVS